METYKKLTFDENTGELMIKDDLNPLFISFIQIIENRLVIAQIFMIQYFLKMQSLEIYYVS